MVVCGLGIFGRKTDSHGKRQNLKLSEQQARICLLILNWEADLRWLFGFFAEISGMSPPAWISMLRACGWPIVAEVRSDASNHWNLKIWSNENPVLGPMQEVEAWKWRRMAGGVSWFQPSGWYDEHGQLKRQFSPICHVRWSATHQAPGLCKELESAL